MLVWHLEYNAILQLFLHMGCGENTITDMFWWRLPSLHAAKSSREWEIK